MEAAAFDSAHELLHGEAVVAGMLLESHIALQKKLITKHVYKEIVFVLISVFGKPDIQPLDQDTVMKLLTHDKKNKQSGKFFSLITGIGSAKSGVSVKQTEIQKAFSGYINA